MVVVVVLHGGRAALPCAAPAVVFVSPLCLAWVGRDPAKEGQDLQGALCDGGQLGAALLVAAADVVDVVAEEAAVALQREREAVMKEEDGGGGTHIQKAASHMYSIHPND